MRCLDWIDKQIQNMEENYLLNKLEILDDHNAYWANFLNMLSEVQHTWFEHLGRVWAGTSLIELNSTDARSIHSAPYIVSSRAQ